MVGTARGMRIGLVQPHLRPSAGVRRTVEFGNRLTDQGHRVTHLVPGDGIPSLSWMTCRAGIVGLRDALDDRFDVVCFTHEPQWYLLDQFTQAKRRVFYAQHDAARVDVACSWESRRAEVDLQLANSAWTADQVEADTGHRPTIVIGGVDRQRFRPTGGSGRPGPPLLVAGDDERPWKGTASVLDAAQRLGLKVARFPTKPVSDEVLARRYGASEVVAVGSWFEGFGQAGLEALACGVPLVTTDNGGCLEYARDGETALVVPPRSTAAMAAAIERIRSDGTLRRTLVANGLDLVAQDFDWDARAEHLAEVLDGVVAGPSPAPPPRRAAPPDQPVLSVIGLQWNALEHTQRFADSIRRTTDVPYELILVDNGSEWDAAAYARAAADFSVSNETNHGFAGGMNQGLALARGEYVAFCNNDTILPERWATQLVDAARTHPNAGIVLPAVTAARNPGFVRTRPGRNVGSLQPFSPAPSAVIYVMPTAVARGLGGWGEQYVVASGEDHDLAFKVWTNDLDIVFDERVLVDHVGKVSASMLKDWRTIWADNLRLFLDSWMGDGEVPRLESCDPERFVRNRRTARAAAGWMHLFLRERERLVPMVARTPARKAAVETFHRAMPLWKKVEPHLPQVLGDLVRSRVKRLGGFG